MSDKPSKVSASVDYAATGKQHGHLTVPYSRNDSAWGSVRLPITVAKGGEGPTVVLTGGNHGDEYEGPLALMKLARSLDPARISGRVIIIPALNLPAVQAGTRVSPIDGVNMNRAFPGRRSGTVTELIAHYVTTEILPQADALMDLHSGGKTLMFSPFACIHEVPDKALMERAKAAMLAFDAPISLVLLELDAEGMLDTAVEEMGKVFVGCELGGGGTTTVETVSIADIGLRNLLAHFGVIDEAPLGRHDRGLSPTRLMHTPSDDCFVMADDAGMYEALVDLGSEVEAGQPVGQIHFVERPERAPEIYRARCSGTVIGRSHQVLVKPGDFLALVGLEL